MEDSANEAVRPGAWAQATSIFGVCAACSVFLCLPVILGRLAEIRGFSAAQLASVASAETLGLAVTALLGPWLLAKFSAQRLMAVGLTLLAGINLLSAQDWGFHEFLALRTAASIAAGLVAPAAYAVLGAARVPERSMSHAVSAQIVTSALGLYFLGQLGEQFGLIGLYGALAVFAGIASLFVATGRIPRVDLGNDDDAKAIPKPALAMIGSVLFFFCALGIYWAFIERVGSEYNIAVDSLSSLLAASNLAALLGSMSAPWFTRRFGDRAVLLFGLALTVVIPLAFLWTAGGAMAYAANLSVFVVLWNLLMVVQMAAVSRLDSAGRAISLTPAAQGFGLSLGPLVVSPVAESSGFVSAVACSGLFALVGLVAAWLAYRGRGRTMHRS